jgi:sialidase-1
MLNIREQNGNTKQRLVALSIDGGTTWNKTCFDAELITPVCQSSLLLFETDKRNFLIYSGPNSSTKREKMTLKVSLDFGATWTHKIEVHKQGSAYSDLVQIDDRNLGLFFEQDFKKIVFQVFALEDLLLE